MKVHNSLKEFLDDYNNKLLDRWTSGEKRDFAEFVEDYLSSNSLALGKQKPLTKNKKNIKSCEHNNTKKIHRVIKPNILCLDCFEWI